MGEIRLVDINDERFWGILFDEACVEGKQAERIEKELESIVISDRKLSRLLMKEIVKKLNELHEEAIKDFRIYGIGEDLGMAKAFQKAIDIVRMCGKVE